MTYPGLFRNYSPRIGKDWLKRIDPEAVQAFVYIGLREADFGQKGGRALYMQKGRAYMSEIGRRGAIMTNIKKEWNKALQTELQRELGVTFDY